MAVDRDALKTQFLAMINDDPFTVTFGTETVSGFHGNMLIKERQLQAGESQSYLFSVWTIHSDWDTVPTRGDIVEIDATEYRVMATQNYRNDLFLRLDLGGKYESR
ncbi:MAG TPA: hypothetical protein VMW24_26950 [Sedimentisphaerales bacterium]|nr:hypothetical protein [Sedimentisphaerales bacterium]